MIAIRFIVNSSKSSSYESAHARKVLHPLARKQNGRHILYVITITYASFMSLYGTDEKQ
jgi:hypothetical protein